MRSRERHERINHERLAALLHCVAHPPPPGRRPWAAPLLCDFNLNGPLTARMC
jgi:hypothetical protein